MITRIQETNREKELPSGTYHDPTEDGLSQAPYPSFICEANVGRCSVKDIIVERVVHFLGTSSILPSFPKPHVCHHPSQKQYTVTIVDPMKHETADIWTSNNGLCPWPPLSCTQIDDRYFTTAGKTETNAVQTKAMVLFHPEIQIAISQHSRCLRVAYTVSPYTSETDSSCQPTLRFCS